MKPSAALRGIMIAMVASLGACLPLEAATFTWDGNANDNEWQSNNNWAGLGGAGADDDLIFPFFAAQRDNHNGFNTNTRFHSITINAPDYAITGNQIFLSAGIVADYGQPGTDSSFTPNIILDANQTFSGVSHPLHLNGVVNLNGHTLTSDGGGGVIYDGFINGTGTLLVAGTTTINGDSSAFGTTQVNVGTLVVNSAGVLGAINLNGGNLTGSGTVGAITVNAVNGGTIGPGGVAATAILTSNGDVTLNSTTKLDIELGGTVSGTQHDQFRVTSHNLDLNGANLNLDVLTPFVPTVGQQFTIVLQIGVGSITGQFAQGTHLTLNGRIFTITYSSSSVVVTYVGNDLTWDGGGANNNWATATNWDFDFAPVDSLGLKFPAGAPADSLTNTNNLFVNNQNLKVSGITFSGGGYTITGNTIDLALGITNTAPAGGTTTFNPGIRASQNLTFLNNGQSEILGGQLDMNGFVLTVDGTAFQTLSGTVIGVAQTGFGGINKNGTGTLRLTGPNSTYNGRTNINAGTVEINNANALGATVGSLDDTIVNPGATLALLLNIFNPDLAERIGLSGTGVGGAGALTESGCNIGCNLSGGVFLSGSSTINVPTIGHKITISGVFGGGGFGLTKIGAGTLIFSANNSAYTGTTTVNAGTLLVNGNNSNSPVTLAGGTLGGTGTVGAITATGGTVAPGASAGTLNVNGNSTFNNGTTLAIEIGGTSAGTFDQLNVTGTLNIGVGTSTLSGTLINFAPTPGQQFTIIQTSGQLTGTFAQGSFVNIGGTLFSITYNANSVVLTAQGGPSPTPTATATATPTATATATATASPVATATASPTPTATASATSTPNPTTLANISTRLRVETGDNVLIGGFIITGTQPKRVIAIATGPSLTAFGVPGVLDDPTLELFQGSTLLESNDNWRDSLNQQAIINSTVAPTDDLESAVIATLPANNAQYTAVVRGANNGTGVGTVQFFDLDRSVDSKLANISTRGFVQTGSNVLIAGTIVLGAAPQKVIVRAIGPSLPFAGILADPTLELRDGNGAILDSNDNWKDSPNKQAIIDTTIPPTNDAESAIVATLPASGAQYTAIVRGVGGTSGIAVVEIFALN
jgi:autotransporter-associated beta strand protein